MEKEDKQKIEMGYGFKVGLANRQVFATDIVTCVCVCNYENAKNTPNVKKKSIQINDASKINALVALHHCPACIKMMTG